MSVRESNGQDVFSDAPEAIKSFFLPAVRQVLSDDPFRVEENSLG
jgi:hypothetical protein